MQPDRAHVLVTGGSGLLGRPLVHHLQSLGLRVSAPEFDLESEASIKRMIDGAIQENGPLAHVAHLAGISFQPDCEKDPERADRINHLGSKSLLTALPKDISLIFASSAQVYQPPENPSGELSEDSRVEPSTVYAQTKWRAELALREMFTSRPDASLTVVRLFNHTHVTQNSKFLLPYLYSQIKSFRDRTQDAPHVIKVGDLSVERDLGAIQDAVQAWTSLILNLSNPTTPKRTRVFNLGSGQAKRLDETARALAQRLQVDVGFEIDPARIRPGEPRRVQARINLLQSFIDFKPRAQSIEGLLNLFFEPL